MPLSSEAARFVQHFVKELKENNAAIFAGAGLSVPSGFVSWAKLLEPLAEELEIKIKPDTDLVALAQYFANNRLGNRHKINQIIFTMAGEDAKPNINHEILSRLPIDTYWTINYDKMIEKSLENIGKRPDVKHTVHQLSVTRDRRDAIVYKMHGDIDHADQAVILRDDYEKYFNTMEPFITALSGDLVEKTFLFLGLSFEDPNLNYILGRIRSRYSIHAREHYCILRKRSKKEGESEEDFEYANLMHSLFIKDLERFSIRTILIDEFAEITEILNAIERGFRSNSIFISGSAHDYSPWTKESFEAFIDKLTKTLIRLDCRIVTGFGLGIGNLVVTSALEEIFISRNGRVSDFLIMRPFPQIDGTKEFNPQIWTDYRNEILSNAGISIFLLGNKLVDGELKIAGGMLEEYELSLKSNVLPIPIGGTGGASAEIFTRLQRDFDKVYPGIPQEIRDAFDTLNSTQESLDIYLEPIFKIVKHIKGVK